MLVEIAEAMGLKFRETDYESNYVMIQYTA